MVRSLPYLCWSPLLVGQNKLWFEQNRLICLITPSAVCCTNAMLSVFALPKNRSNVLLFVWIFFLGLDMGVVIDMEKSVKVG